MKMTSEQTKLVKSDMSLLTRNQRDKNNISIRFAGGRKDGLFRLLLEIEKESSLSSVEKLPLILSEFYCERRKGLTVISEAVCSLD